MPKWTIIARKWDLKGTIMLVNCSMAQRYIKPICCCTRKTFDISTLIWKQTLFNISMLCWKNLFDVLTLSWKKELMSEVWAGKQLFDVSTLSWKNKTVWRMLRWKNKPNNCLMCQRCVWYFRGGLFFIYILNYRGWIYTITSFEKSNYCCRSLR